MKRRLLAVGLLLFVCLVCVWLGSQALTAQVLPRRIVGIPDLVVTEVRLESLTEYTARVFVVVKNIGAHDSASCALALRYTSSLRPPIVWKAQMKWVGGLAPGKGGPCSFTFSGVSKPWQGLLMAVVDAPTGYSPSGRVFEGTAGELNNVFGFTFNTGSKEPPIIWKNPAAG